MKKDKKNSFWLDHFIDLKQELWYVKIYYTLEKPMHKYASVHQISLSFFGVTPTIWQRT